MNSTLAPWLGLAPPKQLARMYDQIGELLDKIDAAEGNAETGFWKKNLAFWELPRVGRSLNWRECTASEIDRRTTMLSGPLYTSPTHPWPQATIATTGDDIPADCFCEPLLQLDMALASKCSGFQFPLGLTQVWMDGDRAVLRFIPDEEVRGEEPSPIDGEVLHFFSRGKPKRHNVFRNWPDGLLVAPWLESALAFSSLGPPVHQYPDTLERFLEDLECQNLDITQDELESFQSIGSHIHSALINFDHCPMNRQRVPLQTECLSVGSMFGRYSSVQGGSYDTFAVPALPILDLSEPNDIFWFGDGTAQLITPANAPGSNFVFDWSTS